MAQEALKQMPELTPAMAELGMALLCENKRGDARSWLERALAANPANELALYGMARLIATAEGYPAAQPWIDRSFALDPNSGSGAMLMANSAYANGDYEGCITWTERALATMPEHAGLLSLQATALQRLHRDDAARTIFQRILAQHPRYRNALLGMAVDANRRKEHPAAYDTIEELLTIGPDTRWLVPYDGRGNGVTIEGWYPTHFNWDIATLHTRLSQLSRVKIGYGIRRGHNGADYPEVIFDQLPIPLIANEKSAIAAFAPYWDGFLPIPVQTGSVREGNRYDKMPSGKRLALVPLPLSCFTSADEVPQGKHLAVIANKFCISVELYKKLHRSYTRSFVVLPFNADLQLPPPITPDYSASFAKREKPALQVIEARILHFLLESLHKYQSQYTEKLGAILLDCDPRYGYVILALKQTPVLGTKDLAIDDFEIDRFSELDAQALYGEYAYLSATQFRRVLKEVIQALAREGLARALARFEHLHIAYAFHDEDLCWLAEVEPFPAQ